jgi:hypothetical protein
MFLAGHFMVIWIFYAVCGLGILFFAAFFIQCCRLSSENNQHSIAELSIRDTFPAAQQTRLLAQWDKEMAEFMARRGRSTALSLLIAANSIAWASSTLWSAPGASVVNQRSRFILRGSGSLETSQGGRIPCKKN